MGAAGASCSWIFHSSSTLCYSLPLPNSSTPKYQHTLYTRTVLVLEMSTRGEIRGNMVHRGSLSWDARLVILQCQFLNIWWAPLCHLPVHSVCPKLWLPPHSIFYNDILMKHAPSTACRGILCMFASPPLHGQTRTRTRGPRKIGCANLINLTAINLINCSSFVLLTLIYWVKRLSELHDYMRSNWKMSSQNMN